MDVFDLFAKLSLDSSEYNEELGDAEKSTSNFGDKLKSGLKVAAGVATAALTTATAATVALTKKFIDAAKATSETGDTIDKQSQKVGFSYKKWQEWNYVLNLAGTSMESATMGIKTMTNQVDKAKNGNKEAVATFKSLGISVKSLKKMSREEIFEKLIGQLQKMPDSTKRAALANKLFGRSGQELTPIFNQSSESTKNLIDQANKLGIIMDDKGVKSSANFKDSLTTLKMTTEGLKNSLMTKFLPSLTSVADGLAKVFGGKTEQEVNEGIKTIEYGMKSLADKLVELTPKIVEVGSKLIKALVDAFVPMLPPVISALFTLLTEALKALVSMLPQLMPAIIEGVKSLVTLLVEVLPILIDGVLKIITALAQWLGTPANAKLIANGVVSIITSLAKTISETLPILLPAIVTLITEVAKALTQEENLKLLLTAVWEIVKAIGIAIVKSIPIILSAIGQVIGNLFTAAVDGVAGILEKLVPIAADGVEGIVNFFKGIFGAIKDFFVNAFNAVKDFFVGIFTKIKDFFVGVIEKIKEAFTNIKNAITGAFENIKNAVTGFFTNIKNAITGAFNNIKNAVTGFFTNIKNSISGALGNIKGFFTNAFNGIKDAIAGVGEKIKGFFTGIIDFFKDLPKKALDLGKRLVEGIWNGIKNMGNWIKEKITGFGKGIVDGFKNIFKIKSPSRIMRDEVGKFIALGIGEGFADTMPAVIGDMKDSLSGMTANLNASILPSATGTGAGGSEFNAGGFTINVYGAEGQDVRTLAKMVSQEIQNLITDKEKAYA